MLGIQRPEVSPVGVALGRPLSSEHLPLTVKCKAFLHTGLCLDVLPCPGVGIESQGSTHRPRARKKRRRQTLT